MTGVIPIKSVAIGGASYQIQPIMRLTAEGITFWLGLELRRPDSPTGRFIAGLDGSAGSSAWITLHECPRAVIAEIIRPEGEALRKRKIPMIDAVEKAVGRKAREARAEWHRLWTRGYDAEARTQKGVMHGYGELHRLIRVARVKRLNATLYESRSA